MVELEGRARESPDWGTGLRRGHHDALMSFATYERIQERRRGMSLAPARKDINKDFQLRGFVCCADCGQPMASCWSEGKLRHYPYHLCDTPDCPSKRKSIPRATIEDGAEKILHSLQSARKLLSLARVMFSDIWAMRLNTAQDDRDRILADLRDTEKQIETLLDRIVKATSATVAHAYEARIDKLERQRIQLSERVDSTVPNSGRLEGFIEHALTFLSNPCNIYENINFALKRRVLNLYFRSPFNSAGKRVIEHQKSRLLSRC